MFARQIYECNGSLLCCVLPIRNVAEPVPRVFEGSVLVSASELPPRGGNQYVPIAQTAPIAFSEENIFVYRGRFEIPLASAISHKFRTGNSSV